VDSGEVALGGLVIAGRDTSPGLALVDGALDGVAVTVEIRVVGWGPASRGALIRAVRSLVLVLRDDRVDATSA
jgi:hypothetical protein